MYFLLLFSLSLLIRNFILFFFFVKFISPSISLSSAFLYVQFTINVFIYIQLFWSYSLGVLLLFCINHHHHHRNGNSSAKKLLAFLYMLNFLCSFFFFFILLFHTNTYLCPFVSWFSHKCFLFKLKM